MVSAVGAGVGGQTANNGRMYITLKPWDERKDTRHQVIARLDRKMQAVQGIRLFLQAGAGRAAWAAGFRARSTSTRCRMPTRTN